MLYSSLGTLIVALWASGCPSINKNSDSDSDSDTNTVTIAYATRTNGASQSINVSTYVDMVSSTTSSCGGRII